MTNPLQSFDLWLDKLFIGLGLTPSAIVVVEAILGVLALAILVLVVDILLVWIERKVVARFQDRLGPNRLGPFGLIQPIADGPYSHALARRGPGVHHIGCVTSSITAELDRIRDSRLLIHPISLKMYRKSVVWLCRPGVPFLVELMQTADPSHTIKGGTLRLPSNVPVPEYIRSLSGNLDIGNADDRMIHIAIGERELSIDPDLA